MKNNIAQTIEDLTEIIQLQTRIIDNLAMELLQHDAITDETLQMIELAATLQSNLDE